MLVDQMDIGLVAVMIVATVQMTAETMAAGKDGKMVSL